MEERKQNEPGQNSSNEKQDQNRNRNNPIPENQQAKNDPGADAAAKTDRKGAGQQQESGSNPVINS